MKLVQCNSAVYRDHCCNQGIFRGNQMSNYIGAVSFGQSPNYTHHLPVWGVAKHANDRRICLWLSSLIPTTYMYICGMESPHIYEFNTWRDPDPRIFQTHSSTCSISYTIWLVMDTFVFVACHKSHSQKLKFSLYKCKVSKSHFNPAYFKLCIY